MPDVHTRHCCAIHGCKYCQDDICTVTQGLEPQEHPCETCAMEGIFHIIDHTDPDQDVYHMGERQLREEILSLRHEVRTLREQVKEPAQSIRTLDDTWQV
jgi:hypothetical protein